MPTPTERILVGTVLLVLTMGLLGMPAQAQGANEVSLEVSGPPEGILVPRGTTELAANVTVGCGLILTSTDPTVTVELGEAPDWLNSTGAAVTFEASDCASGTGSATAQLTLPVTTDATAPGLTPVEFTFLATLDGADDDAKVPEVMVGYWPGYTFEPSGDQTFEVTDETYSFDLLITLDANAATMVMIEDLIVSAGSIDGLNANVYDVLGGEDEDRRAITFKAPDFDWTRSNVTFYTYSHCLEGPDCSPTFEKNITWTFVNVSPALAEDEGVDGQTAESPLLPAVYLALAVAVAVTALRRRPS